ncbi:major capsid protein [uncultured Caudovirales phage]|uniref:Major capsid protein n=1 Tax=uncultured Caudovirales phage TaxID=2100421 RepID=A0A6J5LFU7_9CAUD|nr:major capsid protein [uncultured Caudovirales phage]
MYLTEELQKKWQPVLEHAELDAIKDPYKKAVTALVLENQQQAMMQDAQALNETSLGTGGPTNVAGGVSNFDPILISLVRRALPNLIAYDVAGVQPMTGPTGLIFAMRARYAGQANTNTEAFFNEANTIFSGAQSGSNPYGFQGTIATDTANTFQTGTITSGIGMPTNTAENLGSDTTTPFQQMAFSIEKVTVTAQSRALKAEYSLELAQDLKAIHGLDAETELSNILSTEILAEINREVIRTIYATAVAGAQYGTTTAGFFDLDTDSNGRWSVERFKGLIFQIERDANVIAKQTRRGKGNVLIVSSDVASAMAMAGVLSYTPALQADLQVDDTGNTFAGLLHGRIKVYIDPYFGGYTSNQELVTIGYKGSSPYDAGLFYCPYVPLQMVRAVDQFTFQPKIGFKTRYGMVANPFAQGLTQGNGALNARSNVYYRLFGVKNLM